MPDPPLTIPQRHALEAIDRAAPYPGAWVPLSSLSIDPRVVANLVRTWRLEARVNLDNPRERDVRIRA